MENKFTEEDKDRIINMAWEDRTPFEAILIQFGLSESEVIDLMRREMKRSNFNKWRARVQGRKTKHQQLRDSDVSVFKSAMQRQITGFRISKKKY